MNQRIKNKFKRFLYLFYGEKFFKRFKYNWVNYPSKTEIMQKIINEKDFKSYLEIGCFEDENFSGIKIKNKIGVDPVSGGTHRMTSDEYFQTNKDKFDIILIDGLHTYEQVRKDIFNSIDRLNTNGIIIMHDCLPAKIWNQIVPRIYHYWNGDVWKAIVEMRTLKDYDTYTCFADHGLGVIFKRENRNKLNANFQNFKELKFSDYYYNQNKFMNIISVDKLYELI
tara:strand:- start:1347 stop:2021 length:675 start_codon:yes stop_codon:yes gene_type:complete